MKIKCSHEQLSPIFTKECLSVGFDYRISTGLGKQRLLEGTNKTLCTPGLRRMEQ